MNRRNLLKALLAGPVTHRQLKMYLNVISASLIVIAIMLTWLATIS